MPKMRMGRVLKALAKNPIVSAVAGAAVCYVLSYQIVAFIFPVVPTWAGLSLAVAWALVAALLNMGKRK